MLQYILQVLVFQLLFLLMYELLLKKETFFTYNRFYLLLTPVLALLLPLLNFPVLQQAVPTNTLVLLPEVVLGGAGETAEASEMSGNMGIFNWWWIAYGSGMLISFLLFLKKYWILKNLFSSGKAAEKDGFRIIWVPKSNIACTFYNTIFLGDRLQEEETKHILSHELVHAREKHSLDLLFFELQKLLFWFNPLIYIYQSHLATLHEFIADAGVVEKVEKKTYYQQMLNTAFSTKNISFINQFFNHSIIKKRIVMLQKSRSKSIAKFKYLVLVPLMLLMLTYVACTEDPDEQMFQAEQKSEVLTIEVEDLRNHTPEERAMVKDAINLATEAAGQTEVVVTDGDRTLSFTVDPSGKPQITIATNSGTSGSIKVQSNAAGKDAIGDVPFAVIEEVPVYPGCEGLGSNTALKECMSQQITEFVNRNFDTSLGKSLGLKGINRIYVQFRINKEGKVEVMGARAPHPALEEEARRVVNLLPEMIPGKQKGQKVGVLYSLPITFRVGE